MNFKDKYPEEGERLQFLYERDGLTGAVRFSTQAMKLYRIAVLQHLPPCANRDYRVKYIRAYNEFKRFSALYSITKTMRHYV